MKTCKLVATSLLAMSQSYLVFGQAGNFNASFDDLTPNAEEGPLSPVGVYLNVSFASFNFMQPNATADGLTTHSSPSYAYGIGSASNPAAMTISYPGSTVQSFGLTSLYYGCTINQPFDTSSLPVGCNITATGYTAGSSEPAAVQEFVYPQPVAWTAPLAFGTFEAAFQGLENVTFEQSPALGVEFVLDNIVGSVVT